MKKIFSVIATCATLLLASCSKEKSIDSGDPNGPGTGGGSESGLLVKTSIQTGPNDSTITNFGYDAQNRLIRFWLSGNDNVMDDPTEIVILRNGSGVIQTYTVTDEPGGAGGNMVYTVYHNASTNQYSAKVSQRVIAGSTFRDSLVFNYNALGQISELVYHTSIDGSAYADWAKNELVYSSNGNLTGYKSYYLNTNTMAYELASDVTVEYDDKTNPLILGAEGIVLDKVDFASPNNVTKITITDLEDPANNDVVDYTYVYNNQNKPVTASVAFQSVGLPIPVTFHYQ